MLDKIKKENPFKVPENYFDNFHSEIMGKIQEEKAPKKVSLWKKALPWTGVAAVLCGIIISISILTSNKDTGYTAQSDDKNPEMYASTDEDYFMMFLEDETLNDSYNEFIYTNLSN